MVVLTKRIPMTFPALRECLYHVRKLFDKNDALLRHGIIVLIVTLTCSVVNYLYQLCMGRMLGPEQYGIFGTLISLTYIFAVPVQTIQVTTVKAVSKLQSLGERENLGLLIRCVAKRVLGGSSLGMLIILSTSAFIARFLRLPSVVPIIILGVAFFFQLLVPIFSGSLQGLQRFVRFGALQVANFGSRLVFAIPLVALGFGVHGALMGLIIGGGVSILLGAYFLRDVLRQPPDSCEGLKLSSYSVYTSLTFFFITLFYNIDVIMVKRFFDPAQAGYYVAASTLSRAIFFGSVGIVGAMFPKIATWHEHGNKVVTDQLLKGTLFYTGLLGGIGTLGLNLFPTLAVSLMYGTAYDESVRLVGIFSIGMFFFSLVYVFVFYHLALGRKRFVLLLGSGAMAEVVGILVFHSSLSDVVLVFAVIMGLISLGMTLSTFTFQRKDESSMTRGTP